MDKKEYMKLYREKNKEKIKEHKKEYDKIYRQKNIDKLNKKSMDYYKNNPEKVKEYNLKNKEKKKEYSKNYYQENKTYFEEYRKNPDYRLKNNERIREYKKQNREKVKFRNNKKLRKDYCEKCNSKENLNFHHTDYKNNIGVTLCVKCHKEEHERINQEKINIKFVTTN